MDIKTHLDETFKNYLEIMTSHPILQHLISAEREQTIAANFKALLTRVSSPFSRHEMPGHITGSALVVDLKQHKVLLCFHGKLNKWLQLGGHAEGETIPAHIALREAREECGLVDLEFVPLTANSGEPYPVDLDLHLIPASNKEPEHLHYDLRYLMTTRQPSAIKCSDESADLKWFSFEDAYKLTEEESLLRLIRKAEALIPCPG
jgi:8-oxo-dGTP pyrophosphatase MutT (NUDIX family)